MPEQRQTPTAKNLKAFNAALAIANQHINDLGRRTSPGIADTATDALHRALTLARTLSSRPSATGCTRHPQGAVDPNPPHGWGRCLLCNTHRRRALPTPPPPEPTDTPTRRHVPPDPEIARARLKATMRTINDIAYELTTDSPPQQFDALTTALTDAFRAARDLTRPASATGCAIHPHGAIDPVPPPGGNECLLCNTRPQNAQPNYVQLPRRNPNHRPPRPRTPGRRR